MCDQGLRKKRERSGKREGGEVWCIFASNFTAYEGRRSLWGQSATRQQGKRFENGSRYLTLLTIALKCRKSFVESGFRPELNYN